MIGLLDGLERQHEKALGTGHIVDVVIAQSHVVVKPRKAVVTGVEVVGVDAGDMREDGDGLGSVPEGLEGRRGV